MEMTVFTKLFSFKKTASLWKNTNEWFWKMTNLQKTWRFTTLRNTLTSKQFWRNLKTRIPIYGSDTPLSLFNVDSPWNLNQLDSELSRGLQSNLKGVTSPYCYSGAWKTFFCWHKEDLDLYSINYHHLGRPKSLFKQIVVRFAHRWSRAFRKILSKQVPSCLWELQGISPTQDVLNKSFNFKERRL